MELSIESSSAVSAGDYSIANCLKANKYDETTQLFGWGTSSAYSIDVMLTVNITDELTAFSILQRQEINYTNIIY